MRKALDVSVIQEVAIATAVGIAGAAATLFWIFTLTT